MTLTREEADDIGACIATLAKWRAAQRQRGGAKHRFLIVINSPKGIDT